MKGFSKYRTYAFLLRTRFCGSPLLGIDHIGDVFKEACFLSGMRKITSSYREYNTSKSYVESDVFAGVNSNTDFEESDIDLLVAFNQPCYEKNVNHIRQHGHLIIDRGNVRPVKSEKFTISGIPAIDITRGKTGNSYTAGFALMGHLAYVIDGISREAFIESIRSFHPGEHYKTFLEIFEIGYSISSI
ncbi:MAG: hypothetical protein A2161_03945 [Candidatus Schekmanbacteria bacterium RBG_13_48_7]|uniref:Pyruvate/ketoisovalerate oxidoreductase catalytic domain-containing protein n=1 Tax=Candidatus Schekmanbacteria bacterium RBG_13_48_7 TaxID=1817878 RepID=A0A1F7RUK4_9BACT|nr:MAG: hypothetical protein A2161_03945 [Candidatus Schekmanbacteria bacterium RBG_13_48_7]